MRTAFKTKQPTAGDTDTHGERVRALVVLAHQWIQPYAGDWTAAWLLSDIRAHLWLIRTDASRLVNKKWKGVQSVNWDQPLPDGTRLTDPCNAYVLETAQRCAFLIRHLPNYNIYNFAPHASWARRLITSIQWLYLHQDLFTPRTHFLSRVRSDDVADFMLAYMQGGKAWLLRYPQKCLQLFFSGALSIDPPRSLMTNPFSVTPEHRAIIVDWLAREGLYNEGRFARWPYRCISRQRLAERLKFSHLDLTSEKFGAFLRQFEPDLLQIDARLLVPTDRLNTEFLSHRIPTLQEAVNSTFSLVPGQNVLQHWRQLFSLRRHLPQGLPPTDHIDLRKARLIVSRGKPSDKTPWIPLPIALSYTGEALRLVATVAEPLTDFYIKALRHFHANDLFNVKLDNTEQQWEKRDARNRWVIDNLPDRLSTLNISGWTTLFTHSRGDDVFDLLRSRPSLNDALQVVVGAVCVLIGATVPMREAEYRSLRRNCLQLVEGEGYWLVRKPRKSGVLDQLPDSAKPIPSITARGIRVLAKLSAEVATLSADDDEYAKESLFYLPLTSRTGGFAPRMYNVSSFNDGLNRFCDFVGESPDEYGRRWYVRLHELRKSFLLSFFWCFKYASLDAAAWMADHRNPTHIYAYIQANFPGDEIPRIEAEYAVRQLHGYACNKTISQADNVEDLYRSVCEHFSVSEINLIDESELVAWLELAFAKGVYRVRPYRLHTQDSRIRVSIAFEIQKEE